MTKPENTFANNRDERRYEFHIKDTRILKNLFCTLWKIIVALAAERTIHVHVSFGEVHRGSITRQSYIRCVVYITLCSYLAPSNDD